MKKVIITAALTALVTVGAQAAPAKYSAACFACHGTGMPGAPKAGDAAAWKPRLAKGMDVLVNNAKNGFKGMPAGGACADCSDADYKELITFMSTGK